MCVPTDSPNNPAVSEVAPKHDHGHGRKPEQKPAAGLLETVLKLVGLAGAVSTVMGLPAVYLNFRRMRAPTYYVDYQQVLLAGVLPTVAIAAIALYFSVVLRQVRKRGAWSSLGEGLMGFFAPAIPILLIGWAALMVIFAWGVCWLMKWPLLWSTGLNLTNRELLTWAVPMSLLTYSKPTYQWLRRTVKEWNKGIEAGPYQPVPIEPGILVDKPGLILTVLVGPAVCVTSLAAIALVNCVLYLWEPQLAGVLTWGTIIWSVIGLGSIASVGASAYVWKESLDPRSQHLKNAALAILIYSLLLAGGFLITLYSVKVYPVLSQAWGGGRPERVTVWIDSEKVPPIAEMQRCLPETKLAVEGKLVRVDSTLVFRVGKDTIFLIGAKPTARGLILHAEDVKTVAWGQEQ